MKILVCEPGKHPYVKDIPHELHEMQAVVGGLIQALYFEDNDSVAAVCNEEGLFLEGTGSMILDRVNKIAYACESPRTSKVVLQDFCEQMGYSPVLFKAVDAGGAEIYHTNVMMHVGTEVAVVCLDAIQDPEQRAKVEDSLTGPVFIIDYPASICPLTKRKRDKPEIAERFELFVRGCELANAYTELNDPDLQEKLFRSQLEGQAEEDSMAKMDHDFVRALRYAMPPTGGLGIGIDRLTMMITNTTSIREVILFPLLKPEVFDK